MIYELRVYRVVPGRMAALLTRFEHLTDLLQHAYGVIANTGAWVSDVTSEQFVSQE